MEACTKLVLLSMALVLAIALEPNPAHAQTTVSICRMTKEGLKACLPSVRGSSPAPPPNACCSALSDADLECFCHFKNSGLLSYYGIDFNLATQLPKKCNLNQSFHC